MAFIFHVVLLPLLLPTLMLIELVVLTLVVQFLVSVFFLVSIEFCGLAKKYLRISHSSFEAKYPSIAFSLTESCWISHLLQNLGVSLRYPLTICCDNLSTTYIAANPVLHARTKHIELDHHFFYVRKYNSVISL